MKVYEIGGWTSVQSGTEVSVSKDGRPVLTVQLDQLGQDDLYGGGIRCHLQEILVAATGHTSFSLMTGRWIKLPE